MVGTHLYREVIRRMIRPMTHTDLAPYGSLYAKAFPQEHWGIDWTDESAAAYLQDFFEQKKFVGYVYEEQGEVLGCILAHRRICGLCLNEMAVLPGHQGRGIGSQLLNALNRYSRENDLAGIVLYTSRYAPAAAFYEKHGFMLSEGTVCMYLA